jgi:hypothetical protein
MKEAADRDDFDAAEIVGSPADYWLGDRRVKARTVELGLMAVLFRSEGIGTDYERHTLNERGRECAETGRIPTFLPHNPVVSRR